MFRILTVVLTLTTCLSTTVFASSKVLCEAEEDGKSTSIELLPETDGRYSMKTVYRSKGRVNRSTETTYQPMPCNLDLEGDAFNGATCKLSILEIRFEKDAKTGLFKVNQQLDYPDLPPEAGAAMYKSFGSGLRCRLN